MTKLGYTWYPKDWTNSEKVFELSLSDRGLYRELIDLAMQNDNKTEIKLSVWRRKWGASERKLKAILDKLLTLELIEVNGNELFIPSCEARLNLRRGGKKGGESSKPTPKHIPKPTPNQRERERERERESKIEIENIPAFSVFKKYAIEKKSDVDTEHLKLKYDAWIQNGWKDGNDKKIKNWKTKILHTLPHLKNIAKSDDKYKVNEDIRNNPDRLKFS